MLLNDEERYMSYLNDLEIFKRQQEQQLSEAEETYSDQRKSCVTVMVPAE